MKAREAIFNHPNYSHSYYNKTNVLNAYAIHYLNYYDGKLELTEFSPENVMFPASWNPSPELRKRFVHWTNTPEWFKKLFIDLSLDLLEKQTLRIGLYSDNIQRKFLKDYINTKGLAQRDNQFIFNIYDFAMTQPRHLFLQQVLTELCEKYDIKATIRKKNQDRYSIFMKEAKA